MYSVYPQKKLAVYVAVSRYDSLTIRSHQVWPGESLYYNPEEMCIRDSVDSIDGMSPAISIDQKTTSKNPRSTVGTVTEIYDCLLYTSRCV